MLVVKQWQLTHTVLLCMVLKGCIGGQHIDWSGLISVLDCTAIRIATRMDQVRAYSECACVTAAVSWTTVAIRDVASAGVWP